MFSVFRFHRLIRVFRLHGRDARTASFKQGSRMHPDIVGTRRGTWNQSHTENPQVIGAPVQNTVIRETLLPGFVHPCPEALNILFGDVSFRPRPVEGVKIVFFSSRDKQVLKPAEGNIRFRPQLLFMFAPPSIKTKQYWVSRYAAAK
jgi:hypothetical protein